MIANCYINISIEFKINLNFGKLFIIMTSEFKIKILP